MTIHYLSIQNPRICPTFTYIKTGIKTVEGRKNSLKYQAYKKGDILIFTCNGEKVKTRITYINKYKTVEDYLRKETIKIALPCVKTIEEGVKIYNLWTKEKERKELRKKYGYAFLGIGIKLIKNKIKSKNKNNIKNKSNIKNKL